MSHLKDRRAEGRNWVAVITNEHGSYDHSRSFRTEREAKAYIVEQEAAKLAERFVSPHSGVTTLAEFWVKWEATMANLGVLRPSTTARNKSYTTNLILPPDPGDPTSVGLGALALRDVNHERIQAWVVSLTNRKYAPATVIKAHGLLYQVLEHAVLNRRIIRNPCLDTTLPPVTIEEQMFLDLDQIDELVEAIDPRYALVVMTAAVTGLRASELFGLRAMDILPTGWLHIRQSNVEVRGRVDLSSNLKTKMAHRKVPLPEVILEDLQDHTARLRPNDLVFTAPEGGPVRLALWRKRVWYPATCATGLGEFMPCTFFDDPGNGPTGSCTYCRRPPKQPRGPHYVGLRLHDLRHTAASLWIEEGRELFHIAKYLGHESTRLIEQRYGHLRDERHDAANDALNRHLKARRSRRDGSNVTELARRRRTR